MREFFFAVEKKNREGKGEKYFEKENMYIFAEEKKNEEGRGGKYFEKEDTYNFLGGEEKQKRKNTTCPP